MDQTAEKAHLLYQSGRYDQALKAYQQVLAANPDDADALSYVALCWTHKGKMKAAAEAVRCALAAQPDNDFACYVQAFVQYRLDRLDLAEKAIESAIRLRQDSAEYRGFAAIVRQGSRRWAEALALVENGLEMDPDNVTCARARVRSLLHLDRVGEARLQLQELLRRDPEDPLSQAQMGWTALEQGDRKAAMVAFREALRVEPDLEWAREGLAEALRAGVPLYRFILGYHLKMASLSEEERWALMVGESYFAQALTAIGCITVVLFPVALVYLTVRGIFIYLTWAMRPMTGLFLNLHPFGRYVLDANQRREGWWAAIPLIGMAACTVMAVRHLSVGWLVGAFVSTFALSAVGAVYSVRPGWPRWLVTLAALLHLGMGALAVHWLVQWWWWWPGWVVLAGFVWARYLVTLLATVLAIVTEPDPSP